VKKLIAATISELIETFSVKKYLLSIAVILLLCYINYYSPFHFWLRGEGFLFSTFWYFALFSFFFITGLLIETGKIEIKNKTLINLLFFAPLLFALKVSIPFYKILPFQNGSNHQLAFQQPSAWIGGLVVLSLLLFVYHKLVEGRWSLYGIKKTTSLRPYILLIVLMIPLLIWASLQKDFSIVYPKAKAIANYLGTAANPLHYLLFEAAYACDFISIELFFRGFLIITLSKILGKHCILPIALFYFSIHLGKPMFEAISSFFGGMILGTISYQTKSIWGGWLVHVSIAMLMELFGYLF
jgi:hypothetical protein